MQHFHTNKLLNSHWTRSVYIIVFDQMVLRPRINNRTLVCLMYTGYIPTNGIFHTNDRTNIGASYVYRVYPNQWYFPHQWPNKHWCVLCIHGISQPMVFPHQWPNKYWCVLYRLYIPPNGTLDTNERTNMVCLIQGTQWYFQLSFVRSLVWKGPLRGIPSLGWQRPEKGY